MQNSPIRTPGPMTASQETTAVGAITADGSMGMNPDDTPNARTRPPIVLPVHHRTVVGIVASPVLLRLPDLRHELVFVNRDSQTRLGGQFAVAVLDRRQRLGKQRMLGVAAFLDEEIGDGRRHL